MSSTRILVRTLILVLCVTWPATRAHAQNCPQCGATQVVVTDAEPNAPVTTAGCTTCTGKCKSECNCPKYYFTQEKMPCIKYCRICSKPLVEPCSVAEVPGYGYSPTCWRPMGPLNYTHCTVPPPAILAKPPEKKREGAQPADEAAPPPNRVGLTLPNP
jgi:hypothetical protein